MTVTAYHGTPHTFERFRVPSSGLHFGTLEQAIHACTLKVARLPLKLFETLPCDEQGWRGRIIKANLRLAMVFDANQVEVVPGDS